MGARDRVPRPRKDDDRIKTLVAEVDNAEYFVTNAEKVFDGCSRDFLVAVYRAEQLPVRLRVYAACKAVEFEVPEISTTPRPDTGEALIAAINRLRFTTEEQKKPPPQVLPPPLPKPRVNRKPEPPEIDHVAEHTPSAELGEESGGKPSVPQADRPSTHHSTHHPASDGEDFGGKSDPEISAEETAVVSALPPHLLPGRWRRN